MFRISDFIPARFLKPGRFFFELLSPRNFYFFLLGQKLIFKFCASNSIVRFNPCCIGYCSEAFHFYLFNLFHSAKFQSLLYWILLRSPTILTYFQLPSMGFNPCCIGYCSEAILK
ncbi:hypothetical protein BGP_0577 [Beggiatoa sp. PS]|nr:hypothetical protein BGP_0577 [Beggiatoa sp. PS]